MSTKDSHNVASNFRACFIANIYECPGSKDQVKDQAIVPPHDDPDSNLEKHRKIHSQIQQQFLGWEQKLS